jgi:hypothetical protein
MQQLAKGSKGTGPYASQMSWELDVRITGPAVHKEASAASLSSSKTHLVRFTSHWLEVRTQLWRGARPTTGQGGRSAEAGQLVHDRLSS